MGTHPLSRRPGEGEVKADGWSPLRPPHWPIRAPWAVLSHLWAATCLQGPLMAPALAFQILPGQHLRLPRIQGIRGADSLDLALSCPRPPCIQLVGNMESY